MAPHHLPFFITGPNDSDVLLIGTGLFLIGAVFWVGTLYWRLHSLPERLAHKSQKLQFEIVAVLGLLSLFTHNHLFWIAGLMLALIEVPDFGTPLRGMAGSLEKIAENSSQAAADKATEADVILPEGEADSRKPAVGPSNTKVRTHA